MGLLPLLLLLLLLLLLAGYVSWGLRNPSGLKEKLLKQTAQNLIYALGGWAAPSLSG
jgi:hypothetical protein